MLTDNAFRQNIALLAENFNFQPSPEWLKMIFLGIRDKTTDQLFSKRVRSKIFNKKLSDWNNNFGFGGKPALADCIEMFCVLRLERVRELHLELGVWRSSQLETYQQAISREVEALTHTPKKQLQN